MQPLIETVKNPSGLDSLSNYVGETDFGDFYSLLTQNRDSDSLTRSNFICALELLGGESDNVEVHRFGHWACGWWEVIAIKKHNGKFINGEPILTEEYQIAEQIEDGLESYPVVDETHWSELEYNEACEFWEGCSISERVHYCQEAGVSVFAARHCEMPQTPSGELIVGLN